MIGLGVFRSRQVSYVRYRGPWHVSAFLPAEFAPRVRHPWPYISDVLWSDTSGWQDVLAGVPSDPSSLGCVVGFTGCFLAEVRLQEETDRCDRSVRSLEFAAELH